MTAEAYQPEAGTDQYVHVRVTEKNGQKLTEPQVEQYHPVAYAQVANLHGFKGDVLHDPRTAKQKAVSAPAEDTVKADKLESDADYRARYRVLFREDAPFNLLSADVKRIVDNAEKKLAEGPDGVAPVSPEDAAKLAVAKSDANGDTAVFKAPTDKAGWFALFQQEFPDDPTAQDAITVAQIREKLGK